MNALLKQHLIDPEICIRCHACEEACPIGAISHNDDNVVVNMETCGHCLNCIGPCPTGAIDNWRVVDQAYSVDEQFEWLELPEQQEFTVDNDIDNDDGVTLDKMVQNLLDDAHSGAGGATKAPKSAALPTTNLHMLSNPVVGRIKGNYRLTKEISGSDVRHIIIDMGDHPFPLLEGQTVGVVPPGTDEAGKPHQPRLYSVSSPRDGERPHTSNFSLTVKCEENGVCSSYLCGLERGDEVNLIGPFGSTFLMPNDPQANIIMICTGTGSAPFRAFTMQRQRAAPETKNKMMLFFGARSSDSLPYFGPLAKIPASFMKKIFCLSREPEHPKIYVQDGLIEEKQTIAILLGQPDTYIYVCGLKAMEEGVEAAFIEILASGEVAWQDLKAAMRSDGRYHVETY